MTTRSPDADTFSGTWIFIFELRAKLEGELRQRCGAERGEGGQGEGMLFCGHQKKGCSENVPPGSLA